MTRRVSAFSMTPKRAIDSCVPFRVTPALGGAIAGRLFSVTLGGRNGDSRI